MKDLKEKVLHGGLAKMLAQVTMFALRLGSLMVLARLLSPQDFGLVAMVTAVTGMLNLFRDFGLSMAMVQRKTVTQDLLSTLFWINMLVGVILAIFVLALSPFIASFYNEPRLEAITAALAVSFVFNAAGLQHIAILERGIRFTTLALIDVFSLLVASALGIVMALKGFGYWSLLAMAVTIPLVSTACAWKTTGWVPGRPRRRVGMRSIFQFGATTTLIGLVVYVAYNLEKILLGRFWGAEAIGIYGRAYQLVNIPVDNLNNAAGGLAFSALSRLQDDPERFRSYFLKGYSLVLTLTIPTAVAFALLANDIILVVLGAKWKDATPILRALAPTVVVFALINPLSWLLFPLGLVGRSLKLALVLAPLVIAGYLIGLPYGPIGVAVGFSAALVVWVVPHILWCVHGTVVSAEDIFWVAGKPLLSGLIAGVVVFGIQALGLEMVPLVRLCLGCTLLFGIHFWIIMFVMGEKDVYLNLVRGLLKPGAAIQ